MVFYVRNINFIEINKEKIKSSIGGLPVCAKLP